MAAAGTSGPAPTGANAILDLPRTSEHLKTRGVPVGYQTDEFPTFWNRSSTLAAPIRVDDPQAIADLIRTKDALGLEGGVLVASPVREAHEIPSSEMKDFIDDAVDEAARQGVTRKAVPSFLLPFPFDSTGGRSLATNIALVKNDAVLTARLAASLTDVRSVRPSAMSDPSGYRMQGYPALFLRLELSAPCPGRFLLPWMIAFSSNETPWP